MFLFVISFDSTLIMIPLQSLDLPKHCGLSLHQGGYSFKDLWFCLVHVSVYRTEQSNEISNLVPRRLQLPRLNLLRSWFITKISPWRNITGTPRRSGRPEAERQPSGLYGFTTFTAARKVLGVQLDIVDFGAAMCSALNSGWRELSPLPPHQRQESLFRCFCWFPPSTGSNVLVIKQQYHYKS